MVQNVRVVRAAATAAIVTMLTASGLSASATTTTSEIDPLATVEDITPWVMQETNGQSAIGVSADASVSVPSLPGPDAATSAPGVGFTIDYALDGGATDTAGLTTFEGESDEVDAVVQATGGGVRVLTVIGSGDAPTAYSYTFDVPAGTELVEHAAGSSLQFEDQVYGTLQTPWAVDANGANLPTSYSWEDGTLTQHVDLSGPDIAFPVVADPAWTYQYKFAVTKTARTNEALLRSCFNCYFPVQGAPKSFPVPGQLLPLRVAEGTLNAECKFKQAFTGTDYFGFQFDATKNHIDKLGSNIIFQFRTINGKRYLTTDAYIVNDAFWVKNAFYRSNVLQTWTSFADRLNRAK